MLIHPDNGMYLIRPEEIEAPEINAFFAADVQCLRTIMEWTRTVVCEPHQNLGREGPVCPFVAPSLRQCLFWLSVFHGPLSSDAIHDAMLSYRDWFLTLEPKSGRETRFKTILVLFPGIDRENAPAIIDCVHRILKPEFVSLGLMVGEFYPTANHQGLRNPGFRPLRAPVPMLVMREMISSDLPFLAHDRRYVEAYMRYFGHDIPAILNLQVGGLVSDSLSDIVLSDNESDGSLVENLSICPFHDRNSLLTM